MKDNQQSNWKEWLTPARVLADLVNFATRTSYDQDIDDMDSKNVVVIMFDEVTRDSSFIMYNDPDEFLVEVALGIEKGLRPLAMDISEEYEDTFRSISLEYFDDDPSIEDQAIIKSMFVTNYGIKEVSA